METEGGVDGVVLVHGSNLTARCWDRVVGHIAAQAIAVDLPGRGARPADITAVTLDDCVQSVMDSVADVGWHRFVLVGHSLGGVVITELAVRHPERVAALIYVGGLVPGPGDSAAQIIFGADIPSDEARMPTEDRAAAFFANDMTDQQWREVWREFVPESALLWNARLTGYPAGTPTTYVSMTGDIGVPGALADTMMANLIAAVDHRVLEAGHISMVTKPGELAEIIDDVAAVLHRA